MSVSVAIEELTPEAFEPYGRVISLPRRAHDADGDGWRWWAETVMLEGDGRPWGIGYLDLTPAPLSFDWAERHLRTFEAVVPVSGDCLVYVAPADHLDEPARLPPLERFRVFRVASGTGIVMDRAVWHGAPLAHAGPARALVLIHEGTGAHDVTMVRFPEPITVETDPR